MTALTTTVNEVTADVDTLDATTVDEEIATSGVPVLVEFWAEWCPPCQALAPTLDELATECGDGLRIRKFDADEHADLGARFDVMAVPTLLLFVGGELRMRLAGAHSKARLVEEMAQSGAVGFSR